MNQLPPSTPKGPVDPAFVVGDPKLQRLTDPTVAVVITLNVDIRNGSRTFSTNVTLHELPLMRRLYEGLGGTVVPRAAWVPAIKRRSKLSHLQLNDELSRLGRLYVIPTENGKRDIMSEVYGATGADRLRALRDKMMLAAELWHGIEQSAMDQLRATGAAWHPLEAEAKMADFITEKEINLLVRRLDPADVANDAIELDPIEDESVLDHAGAKDNATPPGDVAAAAPKAIPGDALARMFGESAEGQPVDAIGDVGPVDLNDTDLLIADLRASGLDDAEANAAAIVITSHPADARGDELRKRGIKAKALTAAVKCGKKYDAATAAPTA